MINTARSWGYDDGKEDGLEEGARVEKLSIAKNFLKIGISKEDVIKGTGLSEEEINNLIEELNN